jgi:shikimate kinase
MKQVIALIGLRGAGKSTLGRRVAQGLGWRLIDTDQEVEARLGLTIRQLFAAGREADFRAEEERVVLEALAGEAVVVATGGGAVLSAAARSQLSQVYAVWLTAPAGVLAARTHGSDRPPLTGLAPLQEAERLGRERAGLYAAVARVALDTSGLGEEEAAHVVEQLWRRLSHHHLR